MLNSPINVGKITLKNRVVFPPLTTGYEEKDGSIGVKSLNFYRRLAQGGAGYIVLGDVAPVNTASPTPKLCNDSQIESFKKLADACHEFGAKVALQLFHPEYDVEGVGELINRSMELQRSGNIEECKTVTAQAYAKMHHDMQHFVNEATLEQLNKILLAMGQAAKRAQEAGIDAIQVHGDRLTGSLCSPLLNKREDDFGGSFENRIRFAVEVVRTIKKAAPCLMIDYKLPIITPMEEGLRGKGGLLPDEAVAFAEILEREGVDMLHVAQADHTGNMNDTIPAMGTRPYGFMLALSKEIKSHVKIPVCAVGRIITPVEAEAALSSGACDLVGLGRSLVCDPDFALKAESGEPIRYCVMCNKGCTDSIMNRSYCQCVLNAENGEEYKRQITKAQKPHKVAVVGAGIAGLEAARVLALKGHSVCVYDKALEIGGQINIASVPPRKGELIRALNYFREILPRLGVKFEMGLSPSIETLNLYDDVLVAVGAKNEMLKVEGADRQNVVSAWDVLARKRALYGKCVIIGGGLVGCETAEYLSSSGCDVSIVEMMPQIAAGESSTVLPEMMKDFSIHGVKRFTDTKLKRIEKTHIVCDAKDGQEISLEADFVVMAAGAKSAPFDISGIKANVYRIGDCVKPSDISSAVRSAYDAANSIN